MKHLIEAFGETVTEAIGAGVVLAAVGGAVLLFHAFGDTFISYFL